MKRILYQFAPTLVLKGKVLDHMIKENSNNQQAKNRHYSKDPHISSTKILGKET